MKEDVFAQTEEMKSNVVKVLNTLDAVHKSISSYDDLEDEVKKLSEIMKTIDKFKWNLDEIEHLVIASIVID